MGFMSQRYIPYCCLVYITEKKKYLTKIIKCDEELIIKDIGSIDIFKEKIANGELTQGELIGREAEVFEIYSRLNRINQHKMNPIPVCIIKK